MPFSMQHSDSPREGRGSFRPGLFLLKRFGNLLSLGTLGVAGASVVAFAASRWWIADLVVHFRVQMAFALGLADLFFLVRRKWFWLAFSSIWFLVNAVPVARHAWGPRPTLSEARTGPGEPLRVMTFNVLTQNPRRGEVLRFLENSGVDVIGLLEISPAWARELSTLGKSHPHHRVVPRGDNFGVALYSKIPLESVRVHGSGPHSLPSIDAVLGGRARGIRMIFTHPMPPVGARATRMRDEQLLTMAERCAAENGPVLLAGDLNLTPWSPRFRELLDRGELQDSGKGFGIRPTWHRYPTILGGIAIDHILHSWDLEVMERRVGPDLGSDHRPVTVVLRRRGTGS